MKNIYSYILLIFVAFGYVSCDDYDTIGDIMTEPVPEVYVYHTNPKTGVDYTPEELAELNYNPKKKEEYLEEQPVELAFVSLKMPTKVEVRSDDGTVLATYTSFVEDNGYYKSETYTTSTTDLGLEIGQKALFTFYAVYQNMDGLGLPSLSYDFEVKRIKFVDPNDLIKQFVFLHKSTGEMLGLETLGEDEITLKEDDLYVGTKLVFDGEDDQVEVKEIPDLAFRQTGDFSVGVWVKTTGEYNDPSIIADKNWAGGANPGFVLAYKGASGGVWKMNIGDGSNRVDIDGGSINDDNWHFLVATFDRDGDVTIYQDGVAVGNKDMSSIGDIASGNPIRLAQDGTGGYGDWFVGSLGESYIYDYVLTAEQVAGLSKIKSGAEFRPQTGGVYNVGVTVEGAAASLEDGKFTYTFDGTDDLVTWDNGEDMNFRHTDDFTVAAWVKTTSTGSDPGIISDKNWGGGGNPGFVIAYIGGAWKLNIGDGSSRVDITGGTIGDGEWHLIAATLDRDGNATIYQDGLEVDSKDMSGIGNMDSGFPIRLGQDGTGSYGKWFEGLVANSMIFDYVLSAEQISALYNQ